LLRVLGLTPAVSRVTASTMRSRSAWLRKNPELVSATGSGDHKPITSQDLKPSGFKTLRI
jgi:hypothetical protein